MLYLYGHVEVNALVPDSQLRRITTDNAQINLVTQDVTSDNLVTLYRTTFNSSGLKIAATSRSKNAELIEKVKPHMKSKTNKLSLNLVLASSLLAASFPAFA